jgi:Ca-activated chloride channel family protein
MTFGHPLLLLLLLVLPLAWLGRRYVERRRMRYAVRFTNVEVLAGVVDARSRARLVAPLLLAAALVALVFAVARPHQKALVPSDKAAVILVLDVSGSMQAVDVKPTRLDAARRAIHAFLAKVPHRVRVGLILFSGEAVLATPPTADHDLVGQAVDSSGDIDTFGGTAIGDALALAVQVARRIAGTAGVQRTTLGAARTLAAVQSTVTPKHPLVSILFLSDGRQNRGLLQPLQGAARARAAGFPVYTVALGTTGNTTLRGRGGGFNFYGGGGSGNAGGFGFGGANRLAPDPVTLRKIAVATGGKFFRAKTAGDVKDAYARLGSSLGRVPDRKEITDEFVVAAGVLLLLAGLASALWAPRIP